MSVWNWLEKGVSMPARGTRAGRFAAWWGRRLALRGGRVSIPKNCIIHPEARISARQGSLRMGEGCMVSPGAVLQGNIDMGENCSVQAYSVLVGYGDAETRAGLIRIGNHVRIAPHVMMIAGNHNFDDPDRLITQQGLTLRPITIEDDVWIAGRVNIMAGVTVGRGSVIGAGSVVTKDIPPYSIAVGVPAKVIKRRE